MKRLALISLLLVAGCAEPEFPCSPAQDTPYASGTPYLGIHGDAANSDLIGCTSADAFEEDWRALDGLGLTQPNTFSPDGAVTYATTTNPEPDGCRLHAVDVSTGEVLWCRSYPPSVVQSAVEVDEAGDLYFTAGSSLISVSAAGEPRWERSFSNNGEDDAPWGQHFTPDGHVATVTSSGNVYLVRRTDGEVLTSLSIPETWGFVAPESIDLQLDLASLLPTEILADIETVWGPPAEDDTSMGIGGLLGASGFSDNTVGISPRGRIYVIGGGPDSQTGALVQIHVEGDSSAPVLSPGWYSPTSQGSATSPSISADSRWVTVGDGASTGAVLNPANSDAHALVMDIDACDANTDSDPDPGICGVAFQDDMERTAMIGSPAILPDGTILFWELGLDFSADPQDRDVVALGPEGILWEASLPGDREWTSCITVTDNHVIGTASHVELSSEQLATLTFPSFTDDALVILDRETGEQVFEHPLPDDGAATVTIGSDGALYAGIMGFLSILSVDDRPDLGLVRLRPVAP